MVPVLVQEHLRREIIDRIKRGFVLHMDPEYLIRTYGQVVHGSVMIPGCITPRYMVCIGTEGDATFWSACTTQHNPLKIVIPVEAKIGAWTDNPVESLISEDQIWVMTREQAIEAHLAAPHNKLRATMKFSWIKPDAITWPELPKGYVLHPIKLADLEKQKRQATVADLPPAVQGSSDVAMAHPAGFPELAFDWRGWVKSLRVKAGMSLEAVISAMACPNLVGSALCSIELHDRLFEPEELARFAEVMQVVDHPCLSKIPVCNQAELEYRNRMRTSMARNKKTRAAIATEVTTASTNPNPIPFRLTPTATKPVDTGSPRDALVAEAEALLRYRRISDQEAQALLDILKGSLKAMLEQDPALSFLKQA
jgi:hypothetical protein